MSAKKKTARLEARPPAPVPPNALQLDQIDPALRQPVAVDGEVVGALRHVGELSVVEVHRLNQQGARLEALSRQTTDLTDEDVAEIVALQDTMCRTVLAVEGDADAVHARLTDASRARLIRGFMALQSHPRGVAAGPGMPPAPTTTGAPTPSA